MTHLTPHLRHLRRVLRDLQRRLDRLTPERVWGWYVLKSSEEGVLRDQLQGFTTYLRSLPELRDMELWVPGGEITTSADGIAFDDLLSRAITALEHARREAA